MIIDELKNRVFLSRKAMKSLNLIQNELVDGMLLSKEISNKLSDWNAIIFLYEFKVIFFWVII